MKNYKAVLFSILCLPLWLDGQTPWQSQLVSVGTNGELTYHVTDDGYIIPDFSHAGFKGGGVALPEVTVLKEISPISGDNTGHIQSAINEVGAMPKNSDGMRGAVLLKAGAYDIYGTIYVKYDGVVLRGVGDGADPSTSTIIYARGNSPAQRDVIVMGNTSRIDGKIELSGSRTPITDDTVAVGSFLFHVENSALFNVGDRIIIYHPASQNWINAVNRGGVPYPDPSAPSNPDERWVVNQLPIMYNRYITGIQENQITTDAPVFYDLVKSVSECYIYKPNMNGLIDQVGLENLRVDIETAGGTDENHAWQATRFKSCENAWARNCTFIHFGQSGIITEACSRSTFIHCNAIDPVAIITGERMYNFNTYHYSQLNLFSNCYARNGRHHYVSNGTSTTSGNVFLRCTSESVNSVNEGHRQWTQGMLYDNHKELNLKRDFVLGLYNRVAMGTGHGWAAVHSVLWNCDVDATYGKIGLQKPPTAQNYAIGCYAKSITGNPISASNFTRGFVEGQNLTGLEPNSLYEAQLSDRLRATSLLPSNSSNNGSISVWPSPVSDVLHIRLNAPGTLSYITLTNMTGQLVMEEKPVGVNLTVTTSLLPRGVYLIQAFTNRNIYCTKFIKE